MHRCFESTVNVLFYDTARRCVISSEAGPFFVSLSAGVGQSGDPWRSFMSACFVHSYSILTAPIPLVYSCPDFEIPTPVPYENGTRSACTGSRSGLASSPGATRALVGCAWRHAAP